MKNSFLFGRTGVIVTIVCLCGWTTAFAAPVEWTLQDVELSDGQTVTGSFVFDADTFVLTDISVQASGGQIFDTPGIVPNPQGIRIWTGTPDVGETFMFFYFLPNVLTNAGGTLPLQLGSSSATCTGYTGGCSWPTVDTLQLTGFVTTQAADDVELVINTGPGANVFGGSIVDSNQSLAGRFSLDSDTSVTSIEGWMVSFYDVGYTISIHSDTVDGPGAIMLSNTFTAVGLGLGGGLPTWQGALGLNWDLTAGDYWVSFSTDDYWGGAMPDDAPNPLPEYASDTFGGGWQTFPPESLSFGVRIGASVSVAEPSELLEELGTAVTGEGPGKSLANKIMLAQTYLSVPDEESACLILGDFLNQVRAQRGKKLTDEQADQFTADAVAIMEAVGCD